MKGYIYTEEYGRKENYSTGIVEAATTRVLDHLNADNVAIISACTGIKEGEKEADHLRRNRVSQGELKKDLRAKGLGYIELLGRWVDPDTQIPEDEYSFLIPNISKKDALELGNKYGQYSIIYKDEDGCYEYSTHNDDEMKVGDTVRKFNLEGNKFLHMDTARDVFAGKSGFGSKVKKGNFKFSLGEMYLVNSPRGVYFQDTYRNDRIF